MSNNRRLRRMQERMMANPKFVNSLRRFNDLPTNNDMEDYIKRKVEFEKLIPPVLIVENTPTDKMVEEFTEYTKKKIEVGYDETIKNYYNVK